MSSIEHTSNSTEHFKPVFVVGASRSGTTLMGRILGNSEDIFTFSELHFFEQLWTPEAEACPLARQEALRLGAHLLSIERSGYLSQKSPEQYFDEARSMLQGNQRQEEASGLLPSQIFKKFLLYESKNNGCVIPCEQTPRNVFYLKEIFTVYPDARIILMIRDPRSVLLSQKGKWKRRFLGAKNIPLREAVRARINYHPIVISRLWRSAVRSGGAWADDTRVHTVKFEDLLITPENTIKQVCNFIQIAYHPGLLEVPQVGSSNIADQDNRKGVNATVANNYMSSGGLSSTEVYWCQTINKTIMKKYGYPLRPVQPNPFVLLGNMILLPLQLALALVINLRRMRNVVSAIRKRL